MDTTEFQKRIHEHGDLDVTVMGDEGVGIKHLPTDSEYTVLFDAIKDHEWKVLVDVLTGVREPRMLSHMTRIVSYFSKVENWNLSKMGELRSRHKGNYKI